MILKSIHHMVIDYVKKHPEEFGCVHLMRCSELLEKPLDKMILESDPEDVHVLRDLLPNAFPKKYRTGTLKLSQNIHGAWRIHVIDTSIEKS